MKKIFLAAAVAVLSVMTAKAEGFEKEFSLGVKGGLNVSSVAGGDAGDFYKMKTGLFVGAFAELRLGGVVALTPELIYSRQGGAVKDPVGVDKARLRLNYINVPLLVRLYLTPSDDFTLDLGPQVGFLMAAKEWTKADNGDIEKIDYRGANNVDVSFAAGLSYIMRERVILSARYNLGLTDIDGDGDGKNSVIQLGVGYRF